MFERDRGEADPFGVEAMVAEAAKGAKRGAEDDGGGKGKKARVDDD
jgi:SNW domain-containing protein 1